MWYWEEDGHRVKNHHTWDKQGNFIAYPPKVSTYLEQQWTTGQSADNLQITYKPFHSHTGFSYKVCFQDMNQINKGTGYRRKIMRRQNPNYVAPIASAEPVMATAVPIEEGMGGLAVSNFGGLPQPPEDLFSYALQSISLKDFEAKTKGTNLDHSSKAMGGTLLTWAGGVPPRRFVPVALGSRRGREFERLDDGPVRFRLGDVDARARRGDAALR